MSTLGSMPHASACTACARPISPPRGQTAALFDMFCDLKGATRTPLRAKARHSAVTTTLLPTSDAVPITIRVLALIRIRFLSAPIHRRGTDASRLHLGDHVGDRNQFRMRVTSGQNDV